MIKISILLLVVLAIKFSIANRVIESNYEDEARSFVIDYDRNTFLKDGEPFRFIAGSFHYFRAHPDTWQRKLRTMRIAGLNAVTTYVEWSLHNPKDGVYNWEGIADLVRFINLAKVEDLYVILRPGPYICAERDLGGFPYWLLRKYPAIKLRTNDTNYLNEVRSWYSVLMPKMAPLLYGNGGPIIMVQVENEYGSFYACDRNYSLWIRDETFSYVYSNAVLFTNDGPSMLKCGHIPEVLATLDFGNSENVRKYWSDLRKYQPKGPLVNAEYYPGWLTHWQEPMQRVDTKLIVQSLVDMLDDGANVNFYMFYGGTNFGFTAGANDGGPGRYNADVTSYDYDAPMDEAGDPTEKYMEIRKVIGRYLPLPDIPVPTKTTKRHYGVVKLTASISIFSDEGRRYLSDGYVRATRPLTFEALDQYSGLVLYETELPVLSRDPSVIKIEDIRDRGYVYIDRNLIGVLSRENQVNSLPIMPGNGNKLQILVENQGRINYNVPNDFKGIISNVVLNNVVLRNWNITKYSFEKYEKIKDLIENTNSSARRARSHNQKLLRSGPTVFHGQLNIVENATQDTYLDPSGWGKGIAFINGFHLGRYWPVGPQITLYVPKEVLKTGLNEIVLIEYQKAAESCEIVFTDVPNLDGNRR